jgi:predicted metalloprotease
MTRTVRRSEDVRPNHPPLSSPVATAAQAIGDDRLQKMAQGTAVPDSFTHGSAAQRVQWLTTGLKSGEVDTCNTFAR